MSSPVVGSDGSGTAPNAPTSDAPGSAAGRSSIDSTGGTVVETPSGAAPASTAGSSGSTVSLTDSLTDSLSDSRTGSLIESVAARICSAHRMPGWQSSGKPGPALPLVAEVIQILNRTEEVLFPCYRSRPCQTHADADGVVLSNLHWLHQALKAQVTRVLPFRWLGDEALRRGVEACRDQEAEIERVVNAFFESLPSIRENLMLDVEAAYQGDPAAPSFAEVILSYPGLRAITVHRIAHELYRLGVPLLPRIMSEYIHSRTGIDIHPGARIGTSFFVDHGTGVVIGETTEIGDQVKLFQGVTLGARSVPLDESGGAFKGTRRHPTIGSGVIIYAGATVLGGEVFVGDHSVIGAGATIMGPGSTGELTIGEHSIIGGNVWLTESVEPHSFVFQEHHQLVRVTTRGSHRI